MRIIKLFTILISLSIISSCGGNKESEVTNTPLPKENKTTQDKQLNVTFLLDLSDRIEPSKYPATPEHYERDIAIVDEFVDIFKADMEKKGGYMAKGKIRVLFNPKPKDADINNISTQLNVDLSKAKTPKEKKIVYENLTQQFSSNLKTIYEKTIESKNYLGSDVWRFFKNDVKDYCVVDDPNYRNILVIITDGYLYHENSKSKKGNRTSYLLPQTIEEFGFRKEGWKDKFDTGDFGYISTRDDLENLDILVLEVAPSEEHLDDEDVIRAYLSKWFDEMKVNKYEIYNTDLPNNTKTRIEKFINN